MKVKMLKPYQRLAPGAVTEMNAPVAAILIQRGVAEEVKDAPTVVEKVSATFKRKR